MIAHVVLFKPQGALGADERRAIVEGITAAVASCPTVRACRVGKRIVHGLQGYEQAMREDYAYALMLEFDDVAGLRAYLQHPAHAQLGGVFSSAAAALAYDYELVNLRDAAELV